MDAIHSGDRFLQALSYCAKRVESGAGCPVCSPRRTARALLRAERTVSAARLKYRHVSHTRKTPSRAAGQRIVCGERFFTFARAVETRPRARRGIAKTGASTAALSTRGQ